MNQSEPEFDPGQYPRAGDSVTPTKWRDPDGTVWERTGERRAPHPGEFIWFDTAEPGPYEYIPTEWKGRVDRPCENCGYPDRDHIKTPRSVVAGPPADDVAATLVPVKLTCPGPVTPIWRIADDQDWAPQSIAPRRVPGVADLIASVGAMVEAADPEVIGSSHRAQLLAGLYRAQALERIADELPGISRVLMQRSPYRTIAMVVLALALLDILGVILVILFRP